MPDIDRLLEEMESDEPREAMRESESLLEEGELPEEDESRLAYGLAASNFKLGIFGEALEWTRKTNSDRRWMLRGFCHMNMDQPEKAREAFLESARNFPENNKESLLLAAQSLASMEQFDAALEELDSLLKQDLPERIRAEIHFNQALVLEETDELQEAEEIFESLLVDFSGDHFVDESLFHLAMILEERGKITEAQDKIKTLQERMDDDADFQDQLSSINNRLNKQKQDRNDQLRDYDF
jgi:tetratricopeptide (TPR) repeat protein